jgi:hypothetical protein
MRVVEYGVNVGYSWRLTLCSHVFFSYIGKEEDKALINWCSRISYKRYLTMLISMLDLDAPGFTFTREVDFGKLM